MKKRENVGQGLHVIKNKNPKLTIKKKRGERRLSPKKRHRMLKAVSTACAFAIVILGGFSIASAFMGPANLNQVDLSYGSVSTPVADGELYTAETYDDYKAIDVFARLNWTFAQQENWYSYTHGTVHPLGMEQDVTTYKQYDDGKLISVDLTRSDNSLLPLAARQFCYLKEQDRVIWREAQNVRQQNGLDTVWSTGEPYSIMTISGEDGFKAKNGLPAYELTVYVIEENTVDSGTVEHNDDGTHTVYFNLKPENWDGYDEEGNFTGVEGATSYYVNQMMFTGGLKDAPVFDKLEVSFTFNEKWEVLTTEISESYNAKFGPISAHCTADTRTEYEYNTEKAKSSAYDDYFYKYADSELKEEKKELTSLDCLASLAGLVGEPAYLDLNLTVGGKPVTGAINLDLGLDFENLDLNNLDLSGADARIRLGNLYLWLDGGKAYVKYGDGVKAALSVDELIGMISGESPETQAVATESDAEDGDVLSAIMNGEFSYNETSARLKSVISLGDIDLELVFDFNVDKDLNPGFAKISVKLNLAGTEIAAELKEGNEKIAPLTEAEKGTYIGLGGYIGSLIDIFTADTLRVNIDYVNDELGLAVSGGLDVALTGGVRLAGELTLTYGRAEKTLALAYAGESVYLNLDGVKLSANVNEAIELITSFLKTEDGKDTKALGFDLAGLLTNVFSDEFAANFSMTEMQAEELTALQITVKAGELVKALGIDLKDFDLGDIELAVSDKLSVSVLGASLAVAKGNEPVIPDGVGYTDIVAYAGIIANLLQNDYLAATVTYRGGALTVSGRIDLSISPLLVKGELEITYEKLNKTIGIIYAGEEESLGYVYLTIDGLKLKASVDEAVELVKSLLPAKAVALNTREGAAVNATIEKVLSLYFGDLIALSEEDDVLTVAIKGSDLLSALGVDFELGNVDVTVAADGLTVSALGANIALGAGEKFDCDTEGYKDLTPVLAKIPEILAKQSLTLSGNVTLTIGETVIGVKINEAIIGWNGGLSAYLDLTLAVGDSYHDLLLRVTEEDITLVYGGLGASLAFSELSTIEDAFVAVYDRVRGIIAQAGVDDLLPEIGGISDILDLLQGGAVATAAADAFDWADLLGGLSIEDSIYEGGFLRLVLGSLALDLLENPAEGGLLGLELGYASDDLSVSGSLWAAVLEGGAPALPELDYLTASDFADLIDYVGALVGTIARQNINLTLTGEILSEDEKYLDYNKVKYELSGSVKYYSGASFPFHIDVEGKELVVNTDLYAQISFALFAPHADDSSLYLDLTVIDADLTGAQNGVLDFYVSVSSFGPDKAGYDPLLIYAPADEIMTVLSSAVALLGVDVDILNDFMISKWLTLEKVGQLKGLGDSLKLMIADILGGTNGGKGGEEGISLLADTPASRGFITSVKHGGDSFTIALDAFALFGIEGGDDLTITLGKTYDEEGNSYLAAASVANIYGKNGTEKTSVSVELGYDEVTPAQPAVKGYFSLEGLDKLLIALARSTTHGVRENGTVISGEETPHHYTLNTNFYIEGSVTAKLSIIKIININVDINLIAISVTIDEEGKVGLNARIEYEGVQELNQVAINGDTQVDLTFKDDMIYIKRTQTSYWQKSGLITSKKYYDTPVVLYRAMPAENLMSDMLNQMSFILNFGELITSNLSGDGEDDTSTDPTPAEAVDYGTMVMDILKEFTYKQAADGSESWTIKIDGTSFSDGILGGVTVKIAGDPNGYIRSFEILDASVVIPGVSPSILGLSATAKLNWYNPGGVMDEGVTDRTDKTLDSLGFKAMVEKLNKEGWGEQLFIEAQETTVNYLYNAYAGGTGTLGSETTFVSTGEDGRAAGTLYGALNYPALPDNAEFRYAWLTVYATGDTLPADYKIYAQQNKQLYSVTFRSEEDLGGDWQYDHLEDKYFRIFDMEYGATVTFMANGTAYDISYTITEACEITLPEKLPYAGDESVASYWAASFNPTGVVFTVLYRLDTVNYVSEVAFTVDGALYNEYSAQFTSEKYTLLTPEAEGYLFLGWFRKTESGWVEVKEVYAGDEPVSVTVEALWAKDGWLTLTTSYNDSGILNANRNYTATASVDDTKLIGAMAAEMERSSVKYAFVLNSSSGTPSYGSGADSNVKTETKAKIGGTYSWAHVQITAVYTVNGQNFTFTHQTATAF